MFCGCVFVARGCFFVVVVLAENLFVVWRRGWHLDLCIHVVFVTGLFTRTRWLPMLFLGFHGAMHSFLYKQLSLTHSHPKAKMKGRLPFLLSRRLPKSGGDGIRKSAFLTRSQSTASMTVEVD